MSEAVKMHVKKGDTVLVLSGKDKGKKGKIIEALPKKSKIVVEGVNKVKRHTKPSQKMPQGGIIVKEAAMHSAKVMLVCPACDKPTRIKKTTLANGNMARSCKHCSEIIDKDK
ncbi:50S ribosomal protein L24 [Anaerosporomusa subterranea]|uniref:Large ribosomal subunit protein uL24 n=1 Tax=Anaerosporomusa subterranea TaxID=1794912 RepID=A0A154BUW0_ANASB|nr:50S ribosomal protein L24 [Anaerosporomusa subterranea]KYZ77712.1 50S ribosomal protein L24 [Anaerosporomusa subterranea]